jgi:hypothetical protein
MVIKEVIEKEVSKVLDSLKGKVIFFLCDDKIIRGKIEVHPETGELVVRGSSGKNEELVFKIDYGCSFFFSKMELLDSLKLVDLTKGVK